MKSLKINNLIDHLASKPEWAPYAKGLKRLLVHPSDDFLELSDTLLSWAESFLGKDVYAILSEGYVAFVTDVNRSQIKYEVTKKYLHSSYEEVYASVYDNEEFMKFYHWGVYMSTFAWPHHVELEKVFRVNFLKRHCGMPNGQGVDLGCGSGVWSFLTSKFNPSVKMTSIDISKTSVQNAMQMSSILQFDNNISFHEGDALTWGQENDGGRFDFGMSCFLMEHLEQPQALLQNLSRLIKPRGYAFVTAALTAAEVDHIYEFRRETEVLSMAENAGFRVVEVHSAAPENHKQNNYFLPRSMAMLLCKREGDIW